MAHTSAAVVESAAVVRDTCAAALFVAATLVCVFGVSLTWARSRTSLRRHRRGARVPII